MDKLEEGREKLQFPRTCGIRFSILDGFVLFLGIGTTILFWRLMPFIAFIILFTVLHFFLFCNIFRIRRKAELLWALTFIVNAGIGAALFSSSIAVVATIQLAITTAILSYEIRQPVYHGIACRRWNQKYIEAYLSGEI